ncbi:MAG: efflux RND transporter periplasmic adaptor subunit [Candidatus Moranbacteria bacterium]|jgi:HlyD family secretion protein|nr:efflux RND transporter periplasmic adaptor subunit [Candidatus Moranbacteria bacterium]
MKKITSFVKKRKILSIVVVIILIVAVWFIFFNKKATQIETYTVKKGNITETIMGTGNVQAAQVSVYSTSNGVVQELYVKNGDSVQAGQELFKVKSTSTDQEIATAYANYLTALNNLKKSQQDKESAYAQLLSNKKTLTDAKGDLKYQKNHDENPKTNKDYTSSEKKSLRQDVDAKESSLNASQEKYDDAQTAISASQASVKASKLSYDATQNATIKAQVAGTVSNLSVRVGDVVYFSDITVTSTTIASPVLVIGDLSGYSVKIGINEMERSKIALGQKATIKFDAISGKEYTGTVEKIDDFGVEESGVITYNAYLSVTDQDERMLPKMTANVTVETNSRENVIVVPSKALKPYQNAKGVQVLKTDSKGKQVYEYVSVKIGLKSGSQVEIISGLEEGMIISLSDATITSAK